METNILPRDSSKLVLGHPLSGALYAYFDKELNGGNGIASSQYHTYYKTLYGKHYETYIDIALTLCLIYETIIIPAADNAVPEYHSHQADGEYYHPDFGLFFSWRDPSNYRHIVDEKIDRALNDQQVRALLWRIPKHAHSQIIGEVFAELSLAKRFNATLFTLGLRQHLARRISEIESEIEPNLSGDNKIKVVANYLEVTGLLFQPMNIQSFCYLKAEKELKEYAASFLKILSNFPADPSMNIKHELLILLKNALAKDKLFSKISGVFEGTSSVMDYVGLIPVVGNVATAIGITTDLAARGVDKLNEKHNWYEMASQIERIKSLEKINRALKDIK